MKRIASAWLLTAALLLLAGPVTAGEPIDTLSDDFDPGTGQGQALLWIEDNIYQYVWYIDEDGDGQYSAGDTVIRSLLVRLLPL